MTITHFSIPIYVSMIYSYYEIKYLKLLMAIKESKEKK
jgi:hypothetical protein